MLEYARPVLNASGSLYMCCINYESSLKGNHVSGAHVNYLIEGLDLAGSLFESNNTSNTPRPTDWESAVVGCEGIQWNPIDRIAHHPSLDGWTDLQIHCER